MMSPSGLRLREWTPSDLDVLVSLAAVDSGWPLPYRDHEGLRQLVEGQQAAEILSEGLLRTLTVDNEFAGFVLLNTIPEVYWEGDGIAVECGTYITPVFRGMGLNQAVKQATVRLAVADFQADWCVFVVPVTNGRAQAALNKLNWPWTVATPSTQGPFAKFVRRKAWETGTDAVLYAVRTSVTNRRGSQ